MRDAKQLVFLVTHLCSWFDRMGLSRPGCLFFCVLYQAPMCSGILADDSLEPLESLETTTNSFIVVIRSRSGQPVRQSVEWYGSVEHAQSHERIYFREFSRLVEFIVNYCKLPVSPSLWFGRVSRELGNRVAKLFQLL